MLNKLIVRSTLIGKQRSIHSPKSIMIDGIGHRKKV